MHLIAIQKLSLQSNMPTKLMDLERKKIQINIDYCNIFSKE